VAAISLKVKPGDDISWAGVISAAGITDFTGYVLTAQVRQWDEATKSYGAVLADAVIDWTDATEGAFLLMIADTVTTLWPVNEGLAMDIRIQTPTGELFRTETFGFRTVPGVTGA
jgi:hypothetical protein